MQLATASFALAVILLLGVHYVQAQTVELIKNERMNLMVGDSRRDVSFIGHSVCSSQLRFFVRCQVKEDMCNMYSTERSGFTYTWFKNRRSDVIQDDDPQFIIDTRLEECTSDLTLTDAGVDIATEVTCEVATPSDTDNATSPVFLESINVQPRHFAYGFPEQNISTSTSTQFDRQLKTETGITPFLRETLLLTCDYQTGYSTPEYDMAFLTEFEPFVCVSKEENVGACGYAPQINKRSGNFTFDNHVRDLVMFCGTNQRPCLQSVRKDEILTIRDPARIQPYASPTGQNEDSVTTPELQKKIGENVIICCSFTGIGITSASWTAEDLNDNTIPIPSSTHNIDDRIEQQEPTTNSGLSCINFIMTLETPGTYQCAVMNDVGNPGGERASTRVTLDGEPPLKTMDQTLCLNDEASGDFVLLNCEPQNEDEPNDPFTYQWTFGTTDLAFTQRIYQAFDVGTYTCNVSNSIGSAMTVFTVVANPVAELTIAVTDDMGTSQDRLEGTTMIGNAIPELYHLRHGDTVTLTCVNLKGDESVTLTTADGMRIMSNTHTISNITVESFINGTYRCDLNNPTFPQCPSSNDLVVLRLVGDPPDIPPPNGAGVNIVGGDYCLPIGGQIELVCTVQSGTPVVLYEWRVDGSATVVSTEETYTVTQAGSYQCVAINDFGQDMATSRIIGPPQAMLTFTVTGATGATLTDSCSRLIEPLPTGSQVMHCPYVGDDIEVRCTSDVDSSTNILQHNAETATNGRIEYTDAKITDRDIIAGLYTCTAQLEAGCSTQVEGYAQLYDPAIVDTEIPIPESTPGTNNVAVGRQATPTPIPPGNDVMIFCPYHGLDDPTGRTEFFAVDSEGNLVPSNRLPSPKYSVEQQNNTIVLTINDYSPTEDLYHTFVCNTMNQAGQDSQSITLQEDFVEWCTDPYGQCDMECHLGVRRRQVYCCRRDTRMPVDEVRCAELPRPAAEERCLEFGPCRLDPEWLPGPWSNCSASCGGGYRVRDVTCVIPGMDNLEVDDSMCEPLPLPVIFEYCNLESCCQLDVNHEFCKLIANTPLCSQSAFQAVCCWTCQKYVYG